MREKYYSDDTRLHLVVGEDIPEDAPAIFNCVTLYLREKDDSIRKYADVNLPYMINYARFEGFMGDDPWYIFMEGYDPEIEMCRYSCLVKPLGSMKGVYRLGLGSPIKICPIKPVEAVSINEKPPVLTKK